eukprot:2647792-Pleurochrysis_carterae.AAC.3
MEDNVCVPRRCAESEQRVNQTAARPTAAMLLPLLSGRTPCIARTEFSASAGGFRATLTHNICISSLDRILSHQYARNKTVDEVRVRAPARSLLSCTSRHRTVAVILAVAVVAAKRVSAPSSRACRRRAPSCSRAEPPSTARWSCSVAVGAADSEPEARSQLRRQWWPQQQPQRQEQKRAPRQWRLQQQLLCLCNNRVERGLSRQQLLNLPGSNIRAQRCPSPGAAATTACFVPAAASAAAVAEAASSAAAAAAAAVAAALVENSQLWPQLYSNGDCKS